MGSVEEEVVPYIVRQQFKGPKALAEYVSTALERTENEVGWNTHSQYYGERPESRRSPPPLANRFRNRSCDLAMHGDMDAFTTHLVVVACLDQIGNGDVVSFAYYLWTGINCEVECGGAFWA